MLQLYDVNHNKIGGLENYKDYYFQREINQLDILSFLYPIKDINSAQIEEECYIRSKDNEYVVKEVNTDDDDWTQYVCKVNIEGIQGTPVSHFEAVEQSCENSVNSALVGTGWTVGYCDVIKSRTVKKDSCNAYDVLKEIQNVYGCEMIFDAINKEVYILQSMGSDRGSYFAEQLNLKKLGVQRNTYDYITKLIPIGKDGLDITSVNGGLNYIENHQYSNKILAAYWQDDNYTIAQDLYDDAVIRLDNLSKPYKAYSADIYDLANNSDTYKNILDYSLGDTITLMAKSKNTKEKQRIVKITEYPEEPERNNVEIANKIISLAVMNSNFVNTSNIVDSVVTSDNQVKADKIQGIIDATKASLKAMADSAEKQVERAILFEDRMDGSPTYGAMALGTKGFEIASVMVDGEWQWSTFGTGKGFVADMIIAGHLLGGAVDFDLDSGTLKITHTDGSYSIFSADGISRVVANTNHPYQYLTYTGSVTVTSGQTVTVQLPDEFRGHGFTVSWFTGNYSAIDVAALLNIEVNGTNLNADTATLDLSAASTYLKFNDDGSHSWVNTGNINIVYVVTA